ncbi:Di-copper centre-containing protein [Pluteus cervinus]|uniref:Di-copper centre-containing protein n=1 Tax=Pluteus cervinus TaxID=181527 RepID=A0ACD3ADA0_9AGAR|nr:Di-copper centre-containing protein [Pluteus cervinus]
MFKDEMERYLISGRKGTGTHPRLEIRELQKNKRQWALFVLAFLDIQSLDYSNRSSGPGAQFAQLAGIHGLPYERWALLLTVLYPRGDPEGATEPVKGAKWKAILFPTWHRPSVMLIEQAIGDAAIRIAQNLVNEIANNEECKLWLEAARELRFPYWDWMDPRTEIEGLPEVLMGPTVTIHVPAGILSRCLNGDELVERNIQNPLACYQFGKTLPAGFKDRDEGTGGDGSATPTQDEKGARVNEQVKEGDQFVGTTTYFARWDRTYRWPQPIPDNPTEDYAGLNAELKARAGSLREQIALLFTFPTQVEMEERPRIWDEFSNARFQSGSEGNWPSPYVVGSLENPHDSLHLILGGIGFMGDADYAGFDPIFYLHHANVDRLLALWEYIYPEYWMGSDGYRNRDGEALPFTQEDGSWTSMDEGVLDEVTALAPFRMTHDTYWTSNTIRSLELDNGGDTTPKYYTYPEVAGIHVEQSQAQAGITAEDRERLRLALLNHFSSGLPSTAPQQWKFALALELQQSSVMRSGSYRLDVYFKRYTPDEKFVGSLAVFARQDTSACGACEKRKREKGGMKVRGVVPIPQELVDGLVKQILRQHDAGGVWVESMMQEEVLVQMLMRGLSGEFTKPGGENITVNAGVDGGQSGPKALLLSRAPNPLSIASAGLPRPWKSHGSLDLLRGWEPRTPVSNGDMDEVGFSKNERERDCRPFGSLGLGIGWVWGVVRRTWTACF